MKTKHFLFSAIILSIAALSNFSQAATYSGRSCLSESLPANAVIIRVPHSDDLKCGNNSLYKGNYVNWVVLDKDDAKPEYRSINVCSYKLTVPNGWRNDGEAAYTDSTDCRPWGRFTNAIPEKMIRLTRVSFPPPPPDEETDPVVTYEPWDGIHPNGSFSLREDAAISGFNIEHLKNVTPKECADACTGASRNSWCVSFDYYKKSASCDLSNLRSKDVGQLKTDYAGDPYDHYTLEVDEIMNDYSLVRNAAISGFNVKQLKHVSAESCALACSEAGNNWCVSFDYYKAERKCDLSDRRASDVGGLKTDYSGNPYNHYSKK